MNKVRWGVLSTAGIGMRQVLPAMQQARTAALYDLLNPWDPEHHPVLLRSADHVRHRRADGDLATSRG